MVIDIFACLLIYIFKLPEMLIFGWCRGCGELSGLFKWYNEQRNKHGDDLTHTHTHTHSHVKTFGHHKDWSRQKIRVATKIGVTIIVYCVDF